MNNKTKIKLPDIPLNLERITDIKNCIQSESYVFQKKLEGLFFTEEDLSEINFCKSVFKNSRFLGCDLKKCSFSNIEFISCDFSNSNFGKSTFNNCGFHCCKLTGAVFLDNRMKDVTMTECIMKYTNCGNSLFENYAALDTDFSESTLSECRLKNIELKKCRFLSTNFFKTMLSKIDFRECDIKDLILSDNKTELKGAVVSPLQAVDLAVLLGLDVK